MHDELLPPPQDVLILHHELQQGIQSAIEDLTPLQRQVINLRFFEEKTFEEIGVLLGRHLEGVRQVEARALRSLRRTNRGQRLKAFL